MLKAKKVLALLLALTMVCVLVACGGTANVQDSNAPGNSSENETKVLRVGMDGEPLSLDETSLAGGNGCQFVGWASYGTLWKITTEGEMLYLLAESYEESEDGLTITIHLRETGFHNGDPVTAEDVLFSFRRSDSAMGDRTAAMDLENSYAENDKTLVLKLSHRTPTLIDDIGVIMILSKSWTEDYTNEDHIYVNPLFCGPYSIQEGWSAGQEMVLVKNEYYYNADNIAYDEMVVSFIAEETTRFLSFQNGEYDICYLSESTNIEQAQAAYSVFSAPVQSIVGITIDTENENSNYKNQNLRLAIMHAVDVPAIAEAICGSAYAPATSILPSASWAYKDMSYEYNVDLAKDYVAQYTKETGDNNPTLTLTIHEGVVDEAIAEAVHFYLSEVGINCIIETLDFGSFFQAMMTDATCCYLTMYSGSSDPGSVLNTWNPDNHYTMFKYPDNIAELFRKGCYSVGTQEERTALMHELQDELHAFGKMLPIYEGSINYAIADSSIDISHSVQADGYLIPDLIAVS